MNTITFSTCTLGLRRKLQAACKSNLRQLSIAITIYADEFAGTYPLADSHLAWIAYPIHQYFYAMHNATNCLECRDYVNFIDDATSENPPEVYSNTIEGIPSMRLDYYSLWGLGTTADLRPREPWVFDKLVCLHGTRLLL